MSQKTPHPTPSFDESTRWTHLLIICGGLYLLHACYAILVQRHLYGDASWFLVRMISEAKPTNFYTNFANEFYYSRFVAYWITQLPTVLGIRLGMVSTDSLSYIFGATYFGHRLISLGICYLLLERDEKQLIVFPLLGLFAGSIISDVYIVTEIHISTSFLWPIAILLFRERRLAGTMYWIAVAAILLASFTYESWAFFAPMLLIALFLRKRMSKQAPLPALWPSSALVVCALINWCAIIFPRDPANKDGFVKGTFRILSDIITGPSHWHICAMMAILAASCTLLLTLLPARFKPNAPHFVIGATAVALAIIPPLHFYIFGNAVDLSYAITDRGFAGLVMQVGLLAIFLGVCLFHRDSVATFRAIAVILVGLAAGQVTWQLMATYAWANAVQATRTVLLRDRGAIPCEAIDSGHSPAHIPAPSAVMCTWWATPFSLLQNDHRRVHTILTTHSSFQPFDVYDPSTLPGMSNGTFKYTAYLEALKSQANFRISDTVTFGTGGSGTPMLRSGFSRSESTLTWTDGQTAVLHICLPAEPGVDKFRIAFTIIPHLDTRHLPLSLSVLPGSGSPVTWKFQRANPPWVTRFIDVGHADFGGSECGEIRIVFSNLPASPADLGESGDDRHLGIALVKARIQAL